MPNSPAARTTWRSASTPRRWPSTRGRPRAAAHRPFPSMMIATCKGAPPRSGPSVTGAAAFDINQSLKARLLTKCFGRSHPNQRLNRQDFFFLCGQQLIDFRNRAVGSLLHIVCMTLLVVLGHLVILFQLLEHIETVAAHVANRNAGGFRIFVRDFDQFLAAVLVEFGNPQTQHLTFRRR